VACGQGVKNYQLVPSSLDDDPESCAAEVCSSYLSILGWNLGPISKVRVLSLYLSALSLHS